MRHLACLVVLDALLSFVAFLLLVLLFLRHKC